MRQMASWRGNLRGKAFAGESDKMLYLESIRGLAALVVVFAHILTFFFPYPDVNAGALSYGSHLINELFYGLPLGFMIAGHFSVIVFFILSGYVLTYRYYQTKKASELQKQAAKRYFRLAIPVFCTVMLSYLLLSSGAMHFKDQAGMISGSPEASTLFGVSKDLGAAIYNATIGVFANSDARYNPVLWTMPIELIGSFVIFGLALLVGKLRFRWLFYLGAVVALSQTYYIGFIIGLALADAYHNTNFMKWLSGILNTFYSVGLLGFVLVLASIPLPWKTTSSLLHAFSLPFFDSMMNAKMAHYVGASILLLLVINVKKFQRILSFRPLVWIGSLSFPIYLTQFLVLYSLGSFIFVKAWEAHQGVYMAAAAASGAAVAVTVAISILWKKYIDDMSVQVSRKVAQILLSEKKKEEDAETEIVGVPSEAASSPSIAG